MAFTRLIYNKYYVDQIYDAMFVNRAKDLGVTLGAFDVGVINGLGVNGAGWLTRLVSSISSGLGQVGHRRAGESGGAHRVDFSYPVRMLQSGRVSNYALLIVLGVLVFLGYSCEWSVYVAHAALKRRGAEWKSTKVIILSWILVHAAHRCDCAAVDSARRAITCIAWSGTCSAVSV